MFKGIQAIGRIGLAQSILSTKGIYYFAGTSSTILVKTINLPFLADSINEGTVAQFVKSNLYLHVEQG